MEGMSYTTQKRDMGQTGVEGGNGCLSSVHYASHISDSNCTFSFMTFVDSINFTFLQSLIESKVPSHVLYHFIHEILGCRRSHDTYLQQMARVHFWKY